MGADWDKVRRISTRCFDGLLSCTGYLGGLIAVFMMLIVSYDVVMRYFFNRPTLWVTDISTLGIPFITLLAAAWALQKEAHVKIDLVPQKLAPRPRALLNFITSILALVVCVIFSWQGWAVTYESYLWEENLFRNLVIPKHWLLWVFPFGGLLLTVQLVRRSLHFLSEYRKLGVMSP